MNPYESPLEMAKFLLDREGHAAAKVKQLTAYVVMCAETSTKAGQPEQATFWRRVETEVPLEAQRRKLHSADPGSGDPGGSE